MMYLTYAEKFFIAFWAAGLILLLFLLVKVIRFLLKKDNISKWEKRFFDLPSIIIYAITLVIIGLIFSPHPHDVTEQQMIGEALVLASALKTPMAEYYLENERYPSSMDEMEYANGLRTGKYVDLVEINPHGIIKVSMKTNIDTIVAGKSLYLFPEDGGRRWFCKVKGMPARLLPSVCQSF